MKFAKSGIDSLGMELEFQLLDKNTLDLVDGILPLMELCSDNKYFTPEFVQNTVEIASKKCFSVAELDTHFHALSRDLMAQVESLEMRLCTMGTHPFSTKQAHVTPKPRYLDMESAERYRSHNQITFATHVHLGMSSAEDCIRMMRAIKPYLPMLLAISANSPYWHAHDTGYASYRHRILASTRSYGMPPNFTNWQEFETFYELAHQAKLYNSDRDIHWDVRPRPKLGTMEVRTMDAQPTVADAVKRAALVQTLVFYLRETFEEMQPSFSHEYHYWVHKDNLYQASHLGLNATQVVFDSKNGEPKLVSLGKFTFETVATVIDFIQSSDYYSGLVEVSYLEALLNDLQDPYGYMIQRQHYNERLSFKSTTQLMMNRLRESLC